MALAQLLGGGQPGHAGHPQVDEGGGQVGVLVGQCQGLVAVGRLQHLGRRVEAAQHGRDALAQHRVVVDD